MYIELDDTFQELLEMCLEEQDIVPFIEAGWGISLYPTQKDIVNDIFFRESLEMIINTYTRYGKTFAVGVGLMAKIFVEGVYFGDDRFKEGFRIGIVGPTKGDAGLVKKELLKNGIRNDYFSELIDLKKGNDPEDLIKSRKKDELTFCDGFIELVMLSASSGVFSGSEGGGRGSGIMGEGFDILVLEESSRIPYNSWKKFISRLLEHEEAVMIELGNPWNKQNHFFEHWEDEDISSYHVDWEKGIEEGRHSREYFKRKMKDNIKGSLEWTVLYESVFPDKSESGLVSYSSVEYSRNRGSWSRLVYKNGFEPDRVKYGFDVAGGGKDKAVLFRLEYFKDKVEVTDMWCKGYEEDTMKLVGWARSKIEAMDNMERVHINVDGIGIGEGVADRLREVGFSVSKVKVGNRPRFKKDKFKNRKARGYWKVRSMFKNDDVVISCDSGELGKQLINIEYTYDSRKRIEINDPESGSPDFADSFMLGLYEPDSQFAITSA